MLTRPLVAIVGIPGLRTGRAWESERLLEVRHTQEANSRAQSPNVYGASGIFSPLAS